MWPSSGQDVLVEVETPQPCERPRQREKATGRAHRRSAEGGDTPTDRTASTAAAGCSTRNRREVDTSAGRPDKRIECLGARELDHADAVGAIHKRLDRPFRCTPASRPGQWFDRPGFAPRWLPTNPSDRTPG